MTNLINYAVADFIPIACHYNENTIIGKNGQLIQILRVTGFNNLNYKISLRDTIRNILITNNVIINNNIAIYMQILREEKDLSIDSSIYQSEIAKNIHNRWQKYNNIDKKLVNTLYITIVHAGLQHKSKFRYNIFFGQQKQIYYLDACLVELNHLSKIINENLIDFQSRFLQIVKHEQNYISELTSFYYFLLNLQKKEIILGENNLSEQIATCALGYNSNYMTVTTEGITTNSYIFTIKHPYNLPVETLNYILNIQHSFILTETILPASKYKVKKKFEEYDRIYQASKCSAIIEDLNIEILVKDDHYCKQQIILCFYSQNDDFEDKLSGAIAPLKKKGVIFIHEDINMPRTFFAQIPGNTKYLTRENYNSIFLAANFTAIQYTKGGNYNGSKWGQYITIFNTVTSLPYYFNFHVGEKGHTIIVGDLITQLSSLSYFLILQSTKLHPRIINIEFNNESSNFILLLNGKSIEDDQLFQFDLFNMLNFNNDFSLFLDVLVFDILDSNVPSDAELIKEIVNDIVCTKDAERQNKIDVFINSITANSNSIIVKLAKFLGSEVYKNLFSADTAETFLQEKILNINIQKITQNSKFISLFITIILIRISFNASPTIIYLNYTKDIFKSLLSQKILLKVIDNLSYRNIILIFNLIFKDQALTSNLQNFINCFENKILFTNRFIDNNFKTVFRLLDSEFQQIKSFDSGKQIFLLKNSNDSVYINFDFNTLQ